MNNYYGIGITTTISKSLTFFMGDKLIVIKPLKWKYYYYNKIQHKPVINLFVGITTGDIYQSNDDDM